MMSLRHIVRICANTFLQFNFPIFCQARLEKALFKTLGAQGINCPQVDGRHDKPLVGIHDDLEPDSSK